MLLDILFNGFNGLILGSFYALMAIGLSLILGLNGVINFAHGGFMALAAYLAFTLVPYTGSGGRWCWRRCWPAAWGMWWSNWSCAGCICATRYIRCSQRSASR